MAVCPKCDSQQPEGVRYCDQCGAALESVAPAAPQPPSEVQPDPKTLAAACPACGGQVMRGDAFCGHCGAALNPSPAPSPPPAPQQSEKPVCANCGAQLEPGSNFCDTCGAAVGTALRAPSLPEQSPGSPTMLLPPQGYPPPAVAPGRLVVQDTNASLPFPPGKTEFVVGREDAASSVFPDVDLLDHGGEEGGVSRRHARIFVQDNQIFIEDLNSTNYTYVNQQILVPEQPHPLNDGDEIQLGRIKLDFYTQR
jgi:hypothetical protein